MTEVDRGGSPLEGDFSLGDWLVRPALCRLSRDGRDVPVRAKVMDLLTYLARHAGEVVSKDRLLDDVWGSQSISESALTRTVTELRQVLGDDADRPQFLETIPKRGYRLIGAVMPVPLAGGPGGTGFTHGSHARRGAIVLAGVLVAALVVAVFVWVSRGRSASILPVTIAVLPVEHFNGDPDRAYLADGFVEETVVLLGLIDPARIHVVARTSSRTYKGTSKGAAQIGSELGADYLVESSIREEGTRIRVTSKLIRVSDQLQVWAESYDRETTSVIALQQELSTTIAGKIGGRLSPARSNVFRRQTTNPEAYHMYLRGRDLTNRRGPSTNARAIQYYQRAIALDSDYALAWAGIAETYAASAINGDAAPEDVEGLARDASARALSAGPDLPEAHVARGVVQWWLTWDWPAAEAAFRRAIEIDPRGPLAHRNLAHVLSQMGRHEEAQPAARYAHELDPLDPMNLAMASQIAFQAGDYQDAAERARQAIAIDQDFWIGHMQLGQAYERTGQTELALAALERAQQHSGHNSKPISLRGYLLARTGRSAEARQVIGSLQSRSLGRYVPPYATALVYAGLGDTNAVFEWLERARAVHDVHLMFLTVDSKWDSYRPDPRFVTLLEKCGFTRMR